VLDLCRLYDNGAREGKETLLQGFHIRSNSQLPDEYQHLRHSGSHAQLRSDSQTALHPAGNVGVGVSSMLVSQRPAVAQPESADPAKVPQKALSGEQLLASVWIPFSAGQAWHCSDLFGDRGGQASEGPFQSQVQPDPCPAPGLEGTLSFL
jgi:hypothetical protein